MTRTADIGRDKPEPPVLRVIEGSARFRAPSRPRPLPDLADKVVRLPSPRPVRKFYDPSVILRAGTGARVLAAASLPALAVSGLLSSLPLLFALLAAVAIVLNACLWRYEVELGAGRLDVPTLWGGRERFDLAGLRNVVVLPLLHRLDFEDGSRVFLLRPLSRPGLLDLAMAEAMVRARSLAA